MTPLKLNKMSETIALILVILGAMALFLFFLLGLTNHNLLMITALIVILAGIILYIKAVQKSDNY